MTGDVTWPALTFIAGAIVASVAWTWVFFDTLDRRIDRKIDERLKDIRKDRK